MSGSRATAQPPVGVLLSEHLVIESARALGLWLARHGVRHEGLWIVTWKKLPGAPYVDRWTVLDELLCHGWIDGARRGVDAQRTAQWASPRRHAVWTATYRKRWEKLVEQGRVAEAGRAAVRLAIDAGSWEGLPDVDRLELPSDLEAALSPEPSGRLWFLDQAPSYRRNVLRWLAKARRDDTRQSRVAAIAAASSKNLRLKNL